MIQSNLQITIPNEIVTNYCHAHRFKHISKVWLGTICIIFVLCSLDNNDLKAFWTTLIKSPSDILKLLAKWNNFYYQRVFWQTLIFVDVFCFVLMTLKLTFHKVFFSSVFCWITRAWLLWCFNHPKSYSNLSIKSRVKITSL
jgi:hypothetical protein